MTNNNKYINTKIALAKKQLRKDIEESDTSAKARSPSSVAPSSHTNTLAANISSLAERLFLNNGNNLLSSALAKQLLNFGMNYLIKQRKKNELKSSIAQVAERPYIEKNMGSKVRRLAKRNPDYYSWQSLAVQGIFAMGGVLLARKVIKMITK
ncbi:MAG: hypothetical protein IPL35_09665 [Sphingobacteriales bacterium]|nr:hypothetical protein [Sphingobacteriales bacterium]